MPEFKNNYCLKKYNSFGVDAKTRYFIAFQSTDELKDILNSKIYHKNKSFILGGGSNTLFTKDFEGLILYNKIPGICILEDNKDFIITEVGSGVNWHEFVQWSINKELSGIENLALIPGTVGASPIQNIGAYGMEVKETITKVHALDLKKGKIRIFNNEECKFKYRKSIFKTRLKNKTIITKVEFKLSKKPLNKIAYGTIKKELDLLKISPSPKNIATAVINIRSRKLPDPRELGNSGSFFKNPVISTHKFESLKTTFPTIVGYKISESEIKLAAGWLIESAGLKGLKHGNAGVHKNQALVIVNYGNATGKEIITLAKKIQKTVLEKFGVQLQPEVNIL